MNKVRECGIEQGQLTFAVENRQSDGQLSEGFGQGLHEIPLGNFGTYHGVHVNGVMHLSWRCGCGGHIKPNIAIGFLQGNRNALPRAGGGRSFRKRKKLWQISL